MKKIIPFIVLLVVISFLAGLLLFTFFPKDLNSFFSLKIYRFLALFMIFWVLFSLAMTVPAIFCDQNESLIVAAVTGFFFFIGTLLSRASSFFLSLGCTVSLASSMIFFFLRARKEQNLYRKFAPLKIFMSSLGIFTAGYCAIFTLVFATVNQSWLKHGVEIPAEILEKLVAEFVGSNQMMIRLLNLSASTKLIESQINNLLKKYFFYIVLVWDVIFYFSLKFFLRIVKIFVPYLMLIILKFLKLIGFYDIVQENQPVDTIKLYQ
jgi:hypothetical protein